jgi:hypothetical protein
LDRVSFERRRDIGNREGRAWCNKEKGQGFWQNGHLLPPEKNRGGGD